MPRSCAGFLQSDEESETVIDCESPKRFSWLISTEPPGIMDWRESLGRPFLTWKVQSRSI